MLRYITVACIYEKGGGRGTNIETYTLFYAITVGGFGYCAARAASLVTKFSANFVRYLLRSSPIPTEKRQVSFIRRNKLNFNLPVIRFGSSRTHLTIFHDARTFISPSERNVPRFFRSNRRARKHTRTYTYTRVRRSSERKNRASTIENEKYRSLEAKQSACNWNLLRETSNVCI